MLQRITISGFLFCISSFGLAGCATQSAAPGSLAVPEAPAAADLPAAVAEPDLGVLWVRDAAEYRALSLQAYAAAAKDLDAMINDEFWSALPEQANAAGLEPAIIFDVDETLVTNVRFQIEHMPPFRNSKLDDWNAANKATGVPGAAEFVRLARDSGVAVFFVTNRPCEPKDEVTDPCPQEAVTVGDLNEAGIPADAESVMMANEQPEWTREKEGRRDLIAKNFRVIMLVGDDLGDFIACVRARALEPCTEPATKASRARDTDRYSMYWGNGWYVLPNPMHGSWTTAQ
ncbi:MAG: HAD family acid phosphatase [Woeseia sp.]